MARRVVSHHKPKRSRALLGTGLALGLAGALTAGGLVYANSGEKAPTGVAAEDNPGAGTSASPIPSKSPEATPTPSPTPSEVSPSASASPTASASPEGPADLNKSLRQTIAARYVGCRVLGYTDGPVEENDDGSKKNTLQFELEFTVNPESAAARKGRDQDGEVEWTDPGAVALVVNTSKGQLDGESYGTKTVNETTEGPLNVIVYVPQKPANGAVAGLALESTATSELSDGTAITTMNYWLCDGGVVQYDASERIWEPVGLPAGMPNTYSEDVPL